MSTLPLLTQNSKLRKTSKELGKRVFNFGIPAFVDPDTGKRTCPFAGACAKFCYARKGAYIWSNVTPAFVRRYKATKQDDFVTVMAAEITKKRADYIRIHDSGDFYSPAYYAKWIEIAQALPDVRFYAYTKSLPIVEGVERPENFDLIYSEGGTLDHQIKTDTQRHSRIFDSLDALLSAGYVDTSKFDLFATKWFSNNHRIGLVMH